MNKNFLYNQLKLVLLIFTFIVSACTTTKTECPPNPDNGNLGSFINSSDDEFFPVIYGNKFYFQSNRLEDPKQQYYKSLIFDDKYTPVKVDTIIPPSKYEYSGSMCFYKHSFTKGSELYFAAPLIKNKKENKDIYYSRFQGDMYSQPFPLGSEVNTEHYESNPNISSDGKLLVFVSDRPGGSGETDIYVCKRLPTGSWTKAQCLSNEINTPAQEMSPFIADDGSLYYASKGFRKDKGFDLIKAEKTGEASWGRPKVIAEPFNSEADDMDPFIYEGNIYFSSNREGGCGGFDIYAIPLCGPVVLEGSVVSLDDKTPLNGTLEIKSDLEKEVKSFQVAENGQFKLSISAGKDYLIKYKNECRGDLNFEQRFTAPCSDTSAVKIIPKFRIPESAELFTFEQYKIPFFVTGYYFPNTKENLNALRLKFLYNLLGNADSTRYIEKPGENYDQLAEKVDQALKSAEDFIMSKINTLEYTCGKELGKIRITVIGFSDPRPISEQSKYEGPPVNSSEFNININPGNPIDNEMISKLRAYFTVYQFRKDLEKSENYNKYKDKIIWKVVGRGIDPNNSIENDLKRRVNIKVVRE
ncbi:MAG: hypothetical protein NT007_14895 [Candidatus Kapabacteria bacterium]|nr:hypothetical protein [Candidatus Kapabacteria bacterium]